MLITGAIIIGCLLVLGLDWVLARQKARSRNDSTNIPK
jgi:hypothetical protein